MRLRSLLPALLVFVIAGSAIAQDALGPGRRPKRPDTCMTTAEYEAEAVVRTGMILRDHARACARRGMDGGIVQLWAAFDAANAQQFQDAVQIRAEAYRRNFPNDPNAAQRAANETVASRQLVDFAPVECVVLRDLIGGFKAWDDFLKHVRSTEVGQVKAMFKQCPKGVRGAKRLQQE
jgi:cytochrome c556